MGWDDDWEQGDRLGDYELVAKLGQGGMSRVYKARHVTLATRVAIKTLRPEARHNATLRARFEREGKATARVHHPNVVKVITVGAHRGSPYLVMEFLTGEDLERHLDRVGAMPLRETLAILLPVLSAVQEAHEQGLIHRDLKPANIVLEKARNGALRPVVVDFGIARVEDAPADHVKTRGSALLGTPMYMSPEQTRGTKEVNAKTDQYALGAILYECLTGAPAFVDESVLHLLTRVASGDFVPLDEAREGLPEGLTRAAARAMALDPRERFASVRDFGIALLPFADEVTRARCATLFATADELAPTAPLPPAERDATTEVRAAPRMGTTLGDSTHVLDKARTPSRSRHGAALLLLAAAMIFAGLCGFSALRWSPSRVRPTAHVLDASPVVATARAPAAPPVSVVVPPVPSTPPSPSEPVTPVIAPPSPRRVPSPRRRCRGPNGENFCL